MDELISRQAAIESLALEYGRRWKEEKESFGGLKLAWAEKAINDVPTEKDIRWIPCTQDLPKDSRLVLVSVHQKDGYAYVEWGWYAGVWTVDNEGNNNVVAWMPQPKPYKGEEE